MSIPMISAALVNILRNELAGVLKPHQIDSFLPYEPGDLSLGLYLYNVRPCTDTVAPSISAKGRNIQLLPPRFLTLTYIITALSKVEPPHRAAEDQRILTCAMQAFENNQVLRQQQLGAPPGQWINTIQLQLVDMSHEEMMAVWDTHNTPYRLSAAYRVCPVELPRIAGRMVSRVSDTQLEAVQEDVQI